MSFFSKTKDKVKTLAVNGYGFVKAHWNMPLEGEYLSIKEFLSYCVGNMGISAFTFLAGAGIAWCLPRKEYNIRKIEVLMKKRFVFLMIAVILVLSIFAFAGYKDSVKKDSENTYIISIYKKTYKQEKNGKVV